MNTQECCNHDCNQGRDCPLRKKDETLDTRSYLIGRYDTNPTEYEELKAAVRSFFQDFIDVREESDSGRVFAPITISSSRCMMTEPLAEVLAKMRNLSGSEK